MTTLRLVYLAYALALLAGGVMGFVRAGSVPSLVGSSVYAALALAAAFLVGRNPLVGLGLGTLTSLVVGVFFLMRYLNTGKLMPAGMALALSVVVLIVSLIALAGRLRATSP